MAVNSTRSRVVHLYKSLLFLGKDYPRGYNYFREKVKAAFMLNRHETDPAKVEVLIARGNYIIKEIEAMYMLRKYRALKSRYYNDPDPGGTEHDGGRSSS